MLNPQMQISRPTLISYWTDILVQENPEVDYWIAAQVVMQNEHRLLLNHSALHPWAVA